MNKYLIGKAFKSLPEAMEIKDLGDFSWVNEMVKTKILRRYEISQKELKEKLGLEGDIASIGLWSGLSPAMEKAGKSKDEEVWYFQTESGDIDVGTEEQ